MHVARMGMGTMGMGTARARALALPAMCALTCSMAVPRRYVLYIVLSIIVLLNLLIAMMGDTYQTTKEHATLEWRVDYARRLLRLELQLQVFHRMGLVSLNCGESADNPLTGEKIRVFKYMIYEANAEGGGARKSSSMFEEAVEEEFEEHEKDDDGPGAGDNENNLEKIRDVQRMAPPPTLRQQTVGSGIGMPPGLTRSGTSKRMRGSNKRSIRESLPKHAITFIKSTQATSEGDRKAQQRGAASSAQEGGATANDDDDGAELANLEAHIDTVVAD